MQSLSKGNKAITEAERQALKDALKLLDIDKKRFALSTLFGTGAVGSGIGLGAVSAWLIARAAQLPPVLDLSVAATGVRAFGVGKAIFRYVERISSHWIALNGMARIRTEVYSQLANSPTDVVTSIRRGDLLARTGTDVDELGNVVVKSLLPAAVAVFTSIIAVAIVASLSPLIGVILALMLLADGVIAPLLSMRGARQAEIDQIQNRARLNASALTMLESAAELRVNGKLADAKRTQQSIEADIQKNRDASAKPQALAGIIGILAMGISIVSALVIGTIQVQQGALSTINLVVCTLTPLAAFEATQKLSDAGIQLVRSAQAALRVMELLNRAHTNVDATKRNATTSYTSSNAGSLAAQDLIVGWQDGADIAGPISLELHAGKSIAIVGASGIGKSTLLYTLAGMLTPHAGTVTLDGQPVHEIAREDISRHLILTAEDAHIFETSVLENIRVARADVDEQEAIALLKRAGLAQWLADLPDGVHTVVGTDAQTISGGERRRLLLARALASGAQFLLLDEPGEHLDADTADALIHDLLQTSKTENSTGIVLVTHRLSALNSADEVILLGNSPAQIIARGTHEELLNTIDTYRWSVEQEEE
ncbi:thiol reductant ABC exporter subunit CydC [Arcanobacterium bovis]|uniref:Thiol reductant ABC exporter subunit CydC n=1 Tax=Arcanobacterium bovis TaxID=2529275 RepID=A0A4Q9V084_9ACTO|nr:thiol reductant ABC exporter subunit CydC [Arcanobacterium bovis]TBW22059.1 thiol reductant ABC exporter subunit CydC [Arcanobacterium bovis]